MGMAGVFAEWQPQYAERGIATFPVGGDKKPAVGNYFKMGLPASRQLTKRFGAFEGIGFVCGHRSGITVLDIDSPDERQLTDALDEFGPSPFIVRSGSGNFQAWYKYQGEGRKIRPDKSRPIDILGGGFVVAPPSRSSRGLYGLIQGSLDDLASLPPMRLPKAPVALQVANRDKVETGNRNNTLWRLCMAAAPDCAGWDQLLGFAMKANRERCKPPLSDEEVARIVKSAWDKETSGENGFGRGRRVVISHEQLDCLLDWPDAFVLFAQLKRHHWGRDFVIANGMAAEMPGGGWYRQKLAAARAKLEDLRVIEMVRPAIKGVGPATYRFRVTRIGHQ